MHSSFSNSRPRKIHLGKFKSNQFYCSAIRDSRGDDMFARQCDRASREAQVAAPFAELRATTLSGGLSALRVDGQLLLAGQSAYSCIAGTDEFLPVPVPA